MDYKFAQELSSDGSMLCKVYKEFIIDDVLCLDIIRGAEASKCFCKSDEVNAYVTSIENYFKCKCLLQDTLPTRVNNLGYEFNPGMLFITTEGKINNLIDALTDISYFPNKELEVIGNSQSLLCIQCILYDKTHLSIKIPTVTYNKETKENIWTYRYLVNTDGTLDRNTISYLRTIYPESNYQDTLNRFEQAFESFMMKTPIHFSCNYYLELQKKYFILSECIRGLMHIIRNSVVHSGYRSQYYSLIQTSRMHKKEDKMCNKFTYSGNYSRLTFEKYLEMLNINIDSLDNMVDVTKQNEFIKIAMQNDETKPLGYYVKHKHMKSYPDYAIMNEYDVLEKERQLYAKLIWMYHFAVKTFCYDFEKYICLLNSSIANPNGIPNGELYWKINGCDEMLKMGTYKPRKG